jgi:hypothetical protein
LSNIGVISGNQNGAFNTSGGRRAVFAFDGNPDGRLDGQIDYARMYSDPLINANPAGGTFWTTNNNHPATPHGEVSAGGQAWIMLDYGQTPAGTVTFNKIDIYPRNTNEVLAYRIETSNNGNDWTTAVHSSAPLTRAQSGTPLRDTPTVHELDSFVTARLVRFVILNSQSTGMYGIRGLELYRMTPPLPASSARGIAGNNAENAPRNGDLAFGATLTGSAAVPRARPGGTRSNENRDAPNAFNDYYTTTGTNENYWQVLMATPPENKWLAADYTGTAAQTVTFDRVVVQGRQEARPTSYNIEVQKPGSSEWTVIFTEGGDGAAVPGGLTTADNRGTVVSFAVPITASQVRIRVLTSTGANNNIQLWRFALYRNGDVNGDGTVSTADITMLRRYIAAQNKSAFIAANPTFTLFNADPTGDGFVNSADVTLLRRRIAATNPATVPFGQP